MLWKNREKLERMQELQKMVHEVHVHMTDLITGDDLYLAESYIKHALRVLRSREAKT